MPKVTRNVFVISGAVITSITIICLTVLAYNGKDATILSRVILAIIPTTGFSALAYLNGTANGRAIEAVRSTNRTQHDDTTLKVETLQATLDNGLGKLPAKVDVMQNTLDELSP